MAELRRRVGVARVDAREADQLLAVLRDICRDVVVRDDEPHGRRGEREHDRVRDRLHLLPVLLESRPDLQVGAPDAAGIRHELAAQVHVGLADVRVAVDHERLLAGALS